MHGMPHRSAKLVLVAALVACGSGGDSNAPAAPAPRISVGPQSAEVVAGTPVTFSVTASGGSLAYQWQRNGQDIGGASASQYTLSSPQLADSGATFAVTVSNSAGRAVSGSATLTVQRAIGSVTVSALPDSVFVGATTQMTATVKDPGGTVISRPTTWATTDTSVAVVSTNGVVTAKWAGVAKITATAGVATATSTQLRVLPNKGIPFAIRGVRVPLLTIPGMYDEYLGRSLNTANYLSWHSVFQQIKADGATHVTLGISIGVMVNPTDNDYDDTLSVTPSDTVIAALIADAKGVGLSVGFSFFSNVLNVISGQGGLDRPQPANRALWLQNHSKRMLKWVDFAQARGVQHLMLYGDEIQHLTLDATLTASWVTLTQQARQHFNGTLTTYWWTPGHGNTGIDIANAPAALVAQLDYLGVGFTPNLIRANDPPVSALCRSYHADADGGNPWTYLKGLSDKFGKKIWITDKVFHSFKGAAADEARVYDESIPLTPDESEQANLYESLLSVAQVEGRGWMEGISFTSFDNVRPGAFQLPRYLSGPFSEQPQGKLAETVLREWFTGQRSSSCPIP
jgi:hypothetical protein